MATPVEEIESLASIDELSVDVVSIEPQGTPLYSVLAMPGREQTAEGTYDTMGLGESVWPNGYTWSGKEMDENVKVFTVNGAIASTTEETFVVDSTEGLIANAVLRIKETEEQIRVISVTDGTTFEGKRAVGTTAAANVPNDATLFFVATSVAEGVASVDAIGVEATEVTNYIQKIVSTAKQTDFMDFVRQNPNVKKKGLGFLKRTLREHAKRIERAMLLSQKSFDTSTKQGTMEGVLELAKRSGNVSNISSALTKKNFVAALQKPFAYGNRAVKYAICGADALTEAMALFDADKVYNDKLEVADLSFSKVVLPGGEEVRFIRHPDMTSANGLNGKMIILDPDYVKVVYGKGEDLESKPVDGKTRVIKNTAVSNYAQVTVDIVTYVTLGNNNARAHGIVQLVA